MQIQRGAERLLHALQIVRMHAQLRFAAEHRLLLDQLLDLPQQGAAIHLRRLTDNGTGGLERQLHQP